MRARTPPTSKQSDQFAAELPPDDDIQSAALEKHKPKRKHSSFSRLGFGDADAVDVLNDNDELGALADDDSLDGGRMSSIENSGDESQEDESEAKSSAHGSEHLPPSGHHTGRSTSLVPAAADAESGLLEWSQSVAVKDTGDASLSKPFLTKSYTATGSRPSDEKPTTPVIESTAQNRNYASLIADSAFDKKASHFKSPQETALRVSRGPVDDYYSQLVDESSDDGRGHGKGGKKKGSGKGSRKRKRGKKSAMRQLFDLIREEWFWMSWALLSQLLNVCCQLIGPQLIGIILQCASWHREEGSYADKNHPLLARWSCALFGDLVKTTSNPSMTESRSCRQRPMATAHACAFAYIFSVALTCVFVFLSSLAKRFASQNILYRLRLRLFTALIFADIGTMFDKVGSGQLLNRLSNDVTELTDTISMQVTNRMGNVMLVILCAVYVSFISWELTLAMLTVFPLTGYMSKKFGRYFKKKSKKTQDVLAQASQVASEAIAQIRTVKAYSKEEWHIEEYRNRLANSRDIGYKMAYARGGFRCISVFLNGVAIGIMLYLGSDLVLDGEMGIANFTTFVLYSMKMNNQMRNLIELYSALAVALGATERVFEEYMNNEPQIEANAVNGYVHDSRVNGPLKGCIRLEGVSFCYPTRPRQVVLSDFSLEMKPGTVTALCGMSGSGKSTVASLLLRFYDPSTGRVLLDGVDLREWNLANAHSFMAAVTQQPILFNDSIWNNIIYALGDDMRETVSEAEVFDACKRANCHAFISAMPESYQTVVGERGVQLSGGQKQRVAIARALLRNPRVLIMDEATSALDTESEALVQSALNTLMKHKTVLLIAHRLSTVVNADTIVCLRDGRVVEVGNHRSLIADPSSYYAYLVQNQILAADDQTDDS